VRAPYVEPDLTGRIDVDHAVPDERPRDRRGDRMRHGAEIEVGGAGLPALDEAMAAS